MGSQDAGHKSVWVWEDEFETMQADEAVQQVAYAQSFRFSIPPVALILWDKLFGTFSAELDEEPVVYGLTKNLNTTNPWTVLVHGHAELFRDMMRSGDLGTALRYFFDAPGWKHDGPDERAKILRVKAGV